MKLKYIKEETILRKWEIDGHPNYFFGEDKKLYHIVYRYHLKECKQILKGYSLGYILDSKFYTLKKLKPLIKNNY